MVDLALFNDWKYCSACGLPATPQEETNADDAASDAATSPPPRPRKKLMACADCGCVAYHNANCQRTHWRTGHRRECKTYASAVLPLKELIRWHKLHKRVKKADVAEEGATAGADDLRAQRRVWCWWEADNENGITEETLHGSNRMWQQGAQLWHNKLYREAMQKFSSSLEPYRRAWPYIGKSSGTNERREGDRNDFFERSFLLAKRLLFCAYCELDDRQFDSARQRLVQSLSILMTVFHTSPARASRESIRNVMNDAWMELMLSMEELPQHRIVARHVAAMAIATKSCGWTDAMQRPGYMAHVPLSSTPHIPWSHPSWCRVLENNWIRILNEYNNLMENPLNFTNVGSGERGSGHDDHLVVSGRSWKEYILFGTGAKQSDDDAPFTKQLLRDNVPDAISLAEAGGGEVIFSRLAPRTSIKPHCGPTNLRWTAHLGLVVPNAASDCQIRVKHAWHSWKLGKVLLFDDSYEHEVKNDTDEPRVVLLVRVWHPNLLQEQKGFFLSDAIARKEDDVNKRIAMRNQPRASAAQTASIGHRDMMTFLPAAGSSEGAPAADAKAPASHDMSAAASRGMPGAAAMGAACAAAHSDNNTAGGLSTNMPTLPNSTVPDPLLRAALDRGESMDDDAFNASLDALLGDPEAIPAGGTLFGGLDPAFPPSPDSAFPGNNNKAQDVAGRKRKAPPGNMGPERGHLVSEMSSLTNSSGVSMGARHASHAQAQHRNIAQAAPAQGQGQRPLNYAARGMVQLPPAFAPKPISVAAGSAGGLGDNPNLLGTELFAGGNHVQPQSNPPAQAQQSPFQVASVAAPQPQHLQGQGNSLMSQMGLQTQAQQQQQQQINLGLTWDASMGFPTPSLQAATAGSPVPQAAVSSALPRVASAPVAVGSAANPPTKPGYRPSCPSLSTGKRKRRASATAGTLPVSEDEGERQKRRSERNMREQERSHRIADRIAELRSVLSEAGVHFKPDRHSTLVSVANYIKMLQGRSKSLDEEHRRLLDTISGADRLANEASSNGGIALGGALPGGMTTTVQTHRSLPASSTSSAAGQSTDEEFRVFVQGIDYKSIFAGCGAALAVANVDGRFVDCNDEFLRISEYTRSELLGDENVPRHGAWRRGSNSPVLGVGGQQPSGQAVAVSTSSVANSAMAVKTPDFHRSGSGSPKQYEQRDKDLPTEVRVRKPHRLSLFNLLGGEDMEAVYAAMSQMLRAPEPSALSSSRNVISSEEGDGGGTSSSSSDSCVKSDLTRSMEGDSGSSGNEVSGSGSSGVEPIAAGPGADFSRYTVDHWTGRVKHTRRKNRTLQLNISLVRTADGRPKFFNCAISEVE